MASSALVLVRSTALALVVLALAASGSVPASAQVKGATLTEADFGANGQVLGTLMQIGPGNWAESTASPNKNTYFFDEERRDEWSVYLHDPARGVRMQVDLSVNKVYYSDANTPRRELYQVMSSSDRINGWLAQRVNYTGEGQAQGTFRQIAEGKWEETSKSGGASYRFDETHRSDEAIELYDAARGVTLRLDLMTGKVYYNDSNVAGKVLYQISGVYSVP